MEIMATACDTALNILAVVPEIKSKNRLGMAPLVHLLIHQSTLLRRNHKICYSTVARWHICKEPSKFNATFNKPIHIFVRCKHICIFACVAKGSTERNTPVFKSLHSGSTLFKCALTSSKVVFFFISLN